MPENKLNFLKEYTKSVEDSAGKLETNTYYVDVN